jgi:hypothetical protein
VPWRHANQQPLDLTQTNRFQVLTRSVQMPAEYKCRGRLDNGPRLARELWQPALRLFSINVVDQGGP